MVTSLLATKLFLVPPRPQRVHRPHLVDRLNEGLRPGHKLTVVAAPVGFGKTTLLGEWVANAQRPAAWLSLDENDNDPARFLSYIIAALQTLDAGLGVEAFGLLQAGQPPLSEAILTSLLNDIARSPRDLLLLLDDYHLIENRLIHDALAFLLDHLPPQLLIALASRSDPPLPLARLRARGALIELRAADLRFTPDEAAGFLNQVMGLELSAKDVVTLESRTEGWIAGLQLAALSLQGRRDASEFIQAFAGDHRFIADYLVEEVLHRQTDAVRRFLLETSILDRLNGALCEAVTVQADGGARLESLERGNLFVVPLDHRRHWYRYHHLFADVLRAHLLMEQPDQVATLHQRASLWHEQNGSPADAIRHALAGADFPRAATLIEGVVPEMRRIRQEAMLLGWLQALPDDLFHTRPVLSGHYASVLLQSGRLEGVEAHLRLAERWLESTADLSGGSSTGPAMMVVVDQAEFRRLPGGIAVHRAGLALSLGDVAGTMTHARRAQELVADDDDLGQGAAAALIGLASWWQGDLEGAQESYAQGISRLRQAGHYSDYLGCSLALADIRRAQGRLQDAVRIHEEALRAVADLGVSLVRGTADMHVGLCELHCERNELAAALTSMQRSQDLGEALGLPQNPYRWRVALARLKLAQGDAHSALDLLEEAELRYVGDFSPNVRPIAALKTRLWIAQGRLAEARRWALTLGLSAQDEPSYLREFEHLTLARILLAQYRVDQDETVFQELRGLLDRLLEAAETGGRAGSANEISVLQALAFEAHGQAEQARSTLEHALVQAEPEGAVRLFVDEGPPMAALLRAAAQRGITPTFVRRLLGAFEITRDGSTLDQAIPDPLSEREREVLRLLRTELSGPEIARRLMVSLNTFQTHTRNIYGKLGVNSRQAAVRRAQE
ncbi:MAG: hypothetical protein JNL73_19125, partial [Anaerolineales bacterium]|nr:hypothetical protein [Anaerolineales bacterium]